MRDYQILEIPEYLELLLAVANGYNYASKIAAYFSKEGKIIGHGKKQPTITEQLSTLEKHGLVREKEYSKAKIYEINWDPIIKAFYDITNSALKDIKYAWGISDFKKLKKIGIRNIIPTNLIKDFFSSHIDALTIGIITTKHKGISELVLGFFAAIIQLRKNKVRDLVEKYNIDEFSLLQVSKFASLYLYIQEFMTLQVISTEDDKTKTMRNKNGRR